MIYLDYAANTFVDKEVLDTFYDATQKYFANPNSSHKLGLEAKNKIDESTKEILKFLKLEDYEIVYTSGATEANNLAIKGICNYYKNFGRHIILSGLEHTSIIASLENFQKLGFEVSIVSMNKEGQIDLDNLKSLIREDTILVSIASVDSELGIKQPIEEISDLLKDYPHTFFHTDASQAIGKTEINFNNCDLITIAPHKFYGMNNFGALIKKKNVLLTKMLDGGKSTTLYRSGTPDTANIIALSLAIKKAIEKMDERNKIVFDLASKLLEELNKYSNITINHPIQSLPHFINFSVDGLLANELVKELENNDIYVSAKTSCCPVDSPSKIVYAFTKDRKLATTSIRVSLSHLTTNEEILKFLTTLRGIICKNTKK